MVKKMKSDCEAKHLVMCPNTYICIKPDWLCGKTKATRRNIDVEIIEICSQTVTMIATIFLMRRIAVQERTAQRIN